MEGSYIGQGWEENGPKKIKIKGQQPKRVDCGAVWVNAGSGIK